MRSKSHLTKDRGVLGPILRKLRFLRYVFTRDSAFGALARSASFPYGGTIGWFERRRSTRPRLKGNLKTQPLESADQSIACTLRVQAVEEIAAQFLISNGVAKDAKRGHKQLWGSAPTPLAPPPLTTL